VLKSGDKTSGLRSVKGVLFAVRVAAFEADKIHEAIKNQDCQSQTGQEMRCLKQRLNKNNLQ